MRKDAKMLLSAGAFLPAMPLALNERRQFDEAAQRRLVRYYLAAGADGVAAAVHTTQFAIRDPEIGLFETVLRVVSEEITVCEKRDGRVYLRIAGACGPTEQAVAEVKLALSLGYDAVLLSPGGLGDRDEAYLVERTRKVAAVAPVIGFYLQPSVGGRVLTYDYWQKVCAIENVVAVKCAAFNRYLTLDVMRAAALSGREIALYTGNDDNIGADLLTPVTFVEGGKAYTVRFAGGLLGHWAVWTHTAAEYFHRMRDAADTGAVNAELLALGAQITDCNGAFFDIRNGFRGCIAGVHEVLRRQGLFSGIWCLDPDETLSDGQAAEIDRVYAQYPHLNDDSFVRDFLARDSR